MSPLRLHLHLRYAPHRASRLDHAQPRGQVWLPVGGEVLQLRAPDARFAAFAREHRTLLLATARRLTGSDHDAHDLVQDTLERALKRFSQLPPGGNPRGWVFTILHNAFIDRCRADRGQRATPVDQLAERLAAPDAEGLAAWEQVTPEQVKAAVAKLPEEFRAVYGLHADERKSYEEISRVLGIPKATVGTRLMRARRRLKAILLGEDEGEPERADNGVSGGSGGGHGDA